MCYPNFTASKFVAFSLFMKNKIKIFPLEVSFYSQEKNILLYLLLNVCHLSYSIGSGCLNMTVGTKLQVA